MHCHRKLFLCQSQLPFSEAYYLKRCSRMRRQMQTVAKIMNINAVQISQNKQMVEVKLAELYKEKTFYAIYQLK